MFPNFGKDLPILVCRFVEAWQELRLPSYLNLEKDSIASHGIEILIVVLSRYNTRANAFERRIVSSRSNGTIQIITE